jgi:hypothetical protein
MISLPLTTEQNAWFNDAMREKPSQNPCVALFGTGPDGMLCRQCDCLFEHRAGRKFFKCQRRTFTCGPGSDHRANWPACGKFTPKPPPGGNDGEDMTWTAKVEIECGCVVMRRTVEAPAPDAHTALERMQAILETVWRTEQVTFLSQPTLKR